MCDNEMGNSNFNVFVDVLTVDIVGRLAQTILATDGKNDGECLCRIGKCYRRSANMEWGRKTLSHISEYKNDFIQ